MAKTAQRRPTKANKAGQQRKGGKQSGPSWNDLMKKQGKALDKAKEEAKSGGGNFDRPDIEPGTYNVRVTSAKCGVSRKNNTPYFTLNGVILGKPYEGTQIPLQYLDLTKDWAGRQMWKILDTLGYDIDSIKTEEVPDVAKEITKDRPVVEVNVVESDDINEKTGEPYVNYYLNSLLDSDDFPEDEVEEDDEEEVEDDESEEDEVDESEDENEVDEGEEDEDERPRARRVSKSSPRKTTAKKTAKKTVKKAARRR